MNPAARRVARVERGVIPTVIPRGPTARTGAQSAAG